VYVLLCYHTIGESKAQLDASWLPCPIVAHAGDGNFHVCRHCTYWNYIYKIPLVHTVWRVILYAWTPHLQLAVYATCLKHAHSDARCHVYIAVLQSARRPIRQHTLLPRADVFLVHVHWPIAQCCCDSCIWFLLLQVFIFFDASKPEDVKEAKRLSSHMVDR
jgi:hypothetical protein